MQCVTFPGLLEDGEAVGNAHGEPIIGVVHLLRTDKSSAAGTVGAVGGRVREDLEGRC